MREREWKQRRSFEPIVCSSAVAAVLVDEPGRIISKIGTFHNSIMFASLIIAPNLVPGEIRCRALNLPR